MYWRWHMKDSYLMIAMHRIVRQLDRETASICAKHDLSLSQFAVLEALYHKGPSSVGRLKELILSSDGTIPVVIKNLERDGLVVREEDASDRRRSIISITDGGRARVEGAMPENTAMIAQYFSRWENDEKRTMIRLLEKLLEK